MLLAVAFGVPLGTLAAVMRITRSSVLEALARQYVRTARAKGVRRRAAVVRHAPRNALLPTVTVIGLQFGYLLGSAVLVEYVFSWLGIGLACDVRDQLAVGDAGALHVIGVDPILQELHVARIGVGIDSRR